MAYDGDEAAVTRLTDGLTGGRGLYSWQRRLLRDWLDDRGWDALDAPTGLGKTMVMTLWLIARAAGASLPRRLIYVVDRRAVVDQATDEADRLAARLDHLLREDPLGSRWASRLGLTERSASSDASLETRLAVSTLRGQHLDNRRWMENPAGAAIIVGTVDMIGSRLLFEGYGVSRGMRPVNAGLIGIDSLLILDEAHLVPPFEALVRQAAALGGDDAFRAPVSGLLSPLRVMSLSATGRDSPEARVFRLNEEDLEDEPVHARVTATKSLRVLDDASPSDLAKRLADQAWEYGAGGRRVIVFCNSRRTAQAVEADISKRISKDNATFGKGARLIELLVGERRYRERLHRVGDGTAANPGSAIFNRFRPDSKLDPEGLPAFLIATSAGEVGVDLDADDMVCDLVAWERMVQRLGRVNRRAVPGEARIAIIPVADEKEAEDEIGADRLVALRAPFESPLWPLGADGSRDASPLALKHLKETPELSEILLGATTPEVLRPPLNRALLDAWSLTSLAEHPGRPRIQPWLRGWVETEPRTTVVWRRLFPLRAEDAESSTPSRDLTVFFETAAPPHVSESLEAPTWRVVDVLRKRADALRKAGRKIGETAEIEATSEDPLTESDDDTRPSAEVRGEANASRPAEMGPLHSPVVVLLSSNGEVQRIYDIARLAEANTDGLVRALSNGSVVVDARLGGLDPNGLLDPKAAGPPATIDMPDAHAWGVNRETTVGRRITIGQAPRRDRFWRAGEFRWALSEADDSPGLWVELWRGPGLNPGDPAVSATAQALDSHHDQTGRYAERIANAIGLISPYGDLLVAAARAHDLGKDRKLWQDAMRASPNGRPYAKTEGGGDGRSLNGYRHEFGSLRDALAEIGALFPDNVAADPDLRDLALHLIVAHHGHARPTIKAYDPHRDEPPSRSIPRAREAALRFARLQGQWGPWGLAWWEALLRAADWAASRAVNEAAESSAPEALTEPTIELADG